MQEPMKKPEVFSWAPGTCNLYDIHVCPSILHSDQCADLHWCFTK